MEGMVLGVDAEGGVIRTADGIRYRFNLTDWKSQSLPQPKDKVDFIPDSASAREVYLVSRGLGSVAKVFEGLENSEKTIPTVVYACYLGAFFMGVTFLVGVVLAYVYRGSATGTWYESHFNYQIAIFWKAILGFLIGFFFQFYVSMLIWLAVYVWILIRIVKGWRYLAEGKAVPFVGSHGRDPLAGA